VFESKIVGGAVPKEYMPGVEKGLNSVMDLGPLIGFPVIDFKVDADRRASSTTWTPRPRVRNRIARWAFREGYPEGWRRLLEPMMKVEVVTPEEYTGGIIGDLNSRRGQVTGQEPRGNAIAINAFVPLANMFGYINTCAPCLQGRAQFTMQFDHYEPVPQNISEEIQAKYA
jgi:elongation factor G